MTQVQGADLVDKSNTSTPMPLMFVTLFRLDDHAEHVLPNGAPHLATVEGEHFSNYCGSSQWQMANFSPVKAQHFT